MHRSLNWLSTLLLFLVACEGTYRESALAPLQGAPDAAVEGAATSDPAATAAAAAGNRDTDAPRPSGIAGEACTTGADCGSGLCVDGVCCQSSCDAICSRCDAPGRAGECTLAANDAACEGSCPASTECRAHGSSVGGSNCEAIGRCRETADCTAVDAPAGTPCEAGAGSCDGRGECIVAGKRRLGEACSQDTECGQGHCVVGGGGASICCDADCGGLCQTCGAAGHCNESPRDDARCANIDCPDDNLCRDYAPDLEVNLCRGFGQCRTQADCTFTELRDAVECNCGPEGCKLTAGSSCTTGEECASGSCAATSTGARVCCAQSCGELGLSCSLDGSRCLECEGSTAQCQGNVSRFCTAERFETQTCGNGCDPSTGRCNALRPTGALCDLASQCQTTSCALDVTSTQRCCDPSCAASGRVCGATGQCVCPANHVEVAGACRRQAGQACTNTSECASGFCVPNVSGGSVCCEQGCGGDFCSPDGSRCVECEGSASTCQGTTSQRCADGNLVPTQCANGCNAATGVCNGLLPNGQACNASTQCASGSCAADLNGTSRCCTPNCAATGRVCGSNGACVCANPNDVFANGACGCPQGTRSCGDGRCLANNQCCESCTGGRTCQAGNCACPAGQQFISGQCRLNLGATCSSTGTPCISGLCVDGVCCESPCDGLCMQCQAGSGRCVMPADDNGCPQITCPAPTGACQQAAASNATINANACQALGQCKTAANCAAPTNLPARTACEVAVNVCFLGNDSTALPCLTGRLCDGVGNCSEPTVSCGGVPNQRVGPSACCDIPFPGAPGSLGDFTNACEIGGSGHITVWCDTQNDCATGSFCCLEDFGNFNSVTCRTACPPPFGAIGGINGIVCGSPGGVGACPQGMTCTAAADLPGWSTCQ